MTSPLFPKEPLRDTFTALHKDLIHQDGPRISTMRNYRFAIVPYDPSEEFKLRAEVQRLSTQLVAAGWMVLSIDLYSVLKNRIRAWDPEVLQRIITMEKRLSQQSPQHGLNYVKSKLAPLFEHTDGIAAECARIITDYADRHPDTIDRTVALVGGAQALYPFSRTSALLKHLDGNTRNVPVILFYPGEKKSNPTGLSFMGKLPADGDYRPRIYP